MGGGGNVVVLGDLDYHEPDGAYFVVHEVSDWVAEFVERFVSADGDAGRVAAAVTGEQVRVVPEVEVGQLGVVHALQQHRSVRAVAAAQGVGLLLAAEPAVHVVEQYGEVAGVGGVVVGVRVGVGRGVEG